MATYILLVNYTDKGIQKIKESPKRLGAARMFARKCGVELKDFHLTMGAYDVIAIAEAADDAAVAKFVLTLAGLGFVRTTTVRAFTENEYKDIVKALP